MNKSELIAAIAADTRLAKHNVEIVLDSLARVVSGHLASADPHVDAEVTLPGLGKLKATTRAARTGRNPATGAPVEIPERVAVKFAAGKALDDLLNPGF
jgi:DNA-binding protein HU-beta